MNPPWFEDSDSDDDDWMEDLISKYEQLYNYKMDNPVKILKVHPKGDKILVITERINSTQNTLQFCKSYEITIFQLPEKILSTNREEEGLIKSRELSLKFGLHFNCLIFDAAFMFDENKIALLTEKGLEILKPQNDSNLLTNSELIPMQNKTKIKMTQDNHILVFGPNSFNILSCDFKLRTDSLKLHITVIDVLDVIQFTTNQYLIATTKGFYILKVQRKNVHPVFRDFFPKVM